MGKLRKSLCPDLDPLTDEYESTDEYEENDAPFNEAYEDPAGDEGTTDNERDSDPADEAMAAEDQLGDPISITGSNQHNVLLQQLSGMLSYVAKMNGC